MKKKIIVAIAVLGTAFAGKVSAQDIARLRVHVDSENAPGYARLKEISPGFYDCKTCDPGGCCAVIGC